VRERRDERVLGALASQRPIFASRRAAGGPGALSRAPCPTWDRRARGSWKLVLDVIHSAVPDGPGRSRRDAARRAALRGSMPRTVAVPLVGSGTRRGSPQQRRLADPVPPGSAVTLRSARRDRCRRATRFLPKPHGQSASLHAVAHDDALHARAPKGPRDDLLDLRRASPRRPPPTRRGRRARPDLGVAHRSHLAPARAATNTPDPAASPRFPRVRGRGTPSPPCSG